MMNVVGIRFQQDGKMLNYDSSSLTLKIGDYVIAETAQGIDLGEVISGTRSVEMKDEQISLPRIVRLATPQDIQQATDNRAREQEAYQVCQRKIAEHNLEMKLVSVESMFDNSKLLFYFTANGRVDFRALVKDLASTFKTRIELRQIGVRDEARMLGGLGSCGRPICCGTFLNDFQPVSIKMAKEQNLSLNPTKISGVCGRLMCCLKYEQDQYEQIRKRMPRIGKSVMTPDGNGIVSDLNVLKETVSVRIPAGDSTEIKVYSLDQISRPGSQTAQNTEKVEISEQPDNESIIEQENPSVNNEDTENTVPENREQTGEMRNPKPKKKRTDKPAAARQNSGQNKGIEEAESEIKTENRPARNRNNNRTKGGRDQKYGEPVRRENPEREKKSSSGMNTDTKGSVAEGKAVPAEKPAQRTEKKHEEGPDNTAAAKKDKSKGWAAALEKALKEADQ